MRNAISEGWSILAAMVISCAIAYVVRWATDPATVEQRKVQRRTKRVKKGTASRQDLQYYIYEALPAGFSGQFCKMRDAYDDLMNSEVLKTSPFCNYLKQTISKAYDAALNASVPTATLIYDTPTKDAAKVTAKTLMPPLDDMYKDLTAHFNDLHTKLKEQHESTLREYAKQLSPLTDDVSDIIKQCISNAERVFQ